MEDIAWNFCDDCKEWKLCLDMPAGEFSATTPRLCGDCIRGYYDYLFSAGVSNEYPYKEPPKPMKLGGGSPNSMHFNVGRTENVRDLLKVIPTHPATIRYEVADETAIVDTPNELGLVWPPSPEHSKEFL